VITVLFLDTDDGRHFPRDARDAILEACAGTEPDVRRLLPSLPATIELAVQTGASALPQTGERGRAASPRRIDWFVDPSAHGGIASIARAQLRATLFHELHHLARGWVRFGGAAPASFMDAVVSEGLATAFERDFGRRRPPWGDPPDDVDAWIAELMTLPVSAPYHHWMFRHPDGRQWIGYRAGTHIADRAIAASGRSAAELAHVPAAEVLALAGIA
jgi:uncharacterized protein YjaZ